MKTIKIFLSIAGFALTGLCFGQLFSENNIDKLYYTAYYNASSNSFEHHLNSTPARTTGGDLFDSPSLSRMYSVPIEYDMAVEDWMTKPFESSYYEADLQVESWMEAPFESSYYEADLQVESWMEAPFKSSYYEADLQVESWMTRPFAIGELREDLMEEEIQLESWMSTPWI